MKTTKKLKLLGLGIALVLSLGMMTSQTQPINAAVANKTVKDKKKRVTSITKYYNNKKTKQTDGRAYYGNTKNLKKRTITNYNGKAINSKTTAYVYTYNKRGQLRTNKFGKATRTDYKYFLNNKVSAKRTCTYDAKGKLRCSAWNTKSYVKNKAVAVYKTTPATYKNVLVTPAQPAKPAVIEKVKVEATNATNLYGAKLDNNKVTLTYGPVRSYFETIDQQIKDLNVDSNKVKGNTNSIMMWSFMEYYKPLGLADSITYDLRDYGYDGSQESRDKAEAAIGYYGEFGKVMARIDANQKAYGKQYGLNTSSYDLAYYLGYNTITKLEGTKAGYYDKIITPAIPAKAAVYKKVQVTPAKKVLVRYK